MRRAGLISNKVIILVLLSGFFNLLSFTFDQLVVQSELKTRDLDRKMVINKNNIDNLLIKIDTLGDLSNDAAASGFPIDWFALYGPPPEARTKSNGAYLSLEGMRQGVRR